MASLNMLLSAEWSKMAANKATRYRHTKSIMQIHARMRRFLSGVFKFMAAPFIYKIVTVQPSIHKSVCFAAGAASAAHLLFHLRALRSCRNEQKVLCVQAPTHFCYSRMAELLHKIVSPEVI